MIKHIKKLLLAVSFVLGFLSVTSANALPIGAGFAPVASTEGETAVFFQYQNVYFTESGLAPGVLDTKANLNGYLIGGVKVFAAGRLGVFGFLPYFTKSFGTTLVGPMLPGRVPFGMATDGLGDPVVGAQYAFAKSAWDGGYWGVAVFSTLVVPAGTYTIQSIPAAVGRPPRFLSPGGGNWVPALGFNFLYAIPKFELTLSTSYGVPLEARGYKAGNTFIYAAELGYTIFPWTFKSLTHHPMIIKAIVEFLGTLTGRIKTPNPAIDFLPRNTGGDVFRIAPGLFTEWHGYYLSLSYQFPVSQRINGQQPIKQHHQIIVILNHAWA